MDIEAPQSPKRQTASPISASGSISRPPLFPRKNCAKISATFSARFLLPDCNSDRKSNGEGESVDLWRVFRRNVRRYLALSEAAVFVGLFRDFDLTSRISVFRAQPPLRNRYCRSSSSSLSDSMFSENDISGLLEFSRAPGPAFSMAFQFLAF